MEPKAFDTSKFDPDIFDSDDDSLPDVSCNLCQKEFSNVKSYEQHLKSNKHFKMISKMKLKQEMKEIEKSVSETKGAVEDSTGEIDCDVCSKNFSGYIPYATHLKSNAHFKNVRRQKLEADMKDMPGIIHKDHISSEDDDVLKKPFAECSTCNKVFHDPESFKKHLVGVTHKKKMLEVKTLQSLRNELSKDTEELVEDRNDFFSKCDICSKSFSGPIPFKTHLNSPVHKKEVKRAETTAELRDFFTADPTGQKLICKECNKPFTDPFALKAHLAAKSHEKHKAKKEISNFISEHPEIVAVKSFQNNSSDEINEEDEFRIGSYFFVCQLCHLSLTGPESAHEHVRSKKHLQVKKEREVRKSLQKNLKETMNEKESAKANAVKHDNNRTHVNGMLYENNMTTTTSIEELIKDAISDIDEFEMI